MRLDFSPAFQQAQLDRRQISLPPSLCALKGRSILFMTDLHVSAMFPLKALKRLIDQANTLAPDLILLGGDLAESAEWQEAALPYFDALKAPLGKYAVLGNNDYEHMTIHSRLSTECMQDAGVQTLVENQAEIDAGGCRLLIAGLDVYNSLGCEPPVYFSRSNEHDFRIVMAHYPQAIPLHSAEFAAPPHLGLAGHTHGGQFRLGPLTPFSIGFERRKKAYLMPPSGWTEQCGFPVVVSNGVGVSRLPFRLNVPATIHLITLE